MAFPCIYKIVTNSFGSALEYQEVKPLGIDKAAYVVGGILGAIFGTIGYFTTKTECPP